MAYIQERQGRDNKRVYRVQVRLRGYPTQTATFARKTDAKRWAQQTEAAIREGRHFKTILAKQHTQAESIDRYMRDVMPNLKSASDRATQLRWWKTQLGSYVLADVTPAVVAEWRDKLFRGETRGRKQRSAATTNRYLSALSHVFTIAVREWQWAEDNPLRKVSTLKESPGRVRFLNDEERTRLLAECKAHSTELYTIVVLALSTGARQNEIMSLSWKEVDLTRRALILLATKNGDRRALPLQGHAYALVYDMAKRRRIDTSLLFPSRKNPNKPLAIQNIWHAAVKRADIADFRFHDLRHSTASYLAMNGATLAEIAGVLGHKTLQMVKRYTHFSDQHTSQVVARMNTAIFGD